VRVPRILTTSFPEILATCRYRPEEKGSVENLVGWVKGSFFKQRRFLDRPDLEQQLREWLTETNTVRPSRATGVSPAARIAEERARLRPLKIAPDDLALRVSPMGVVMHDGHPYSMPPDAIGLPGTLYLYRDHVRIVAGRFTAEHVRQFQPGDGRSCLSIAPRGRGGVRETGAALFIAVGAHDLDLFYFLFLRSRFRSRRSCRTSRRSLRRSALSFRASR
jgi:hypothetical protein